MIESAGVIVIDTSGEEPKCLVVRSYANWDFPKGQLDPGEDHRSAAMRELAEETGLGGGDVEMRPEVSPSVVYGSGKGRKRATYFVANRKSSTDPCLPVNPELGKPEHDEWRWCTVSELGALLPKRLGPVYSYIQKII